jgi:two-component system response regulator AlgR
MRVLIVDDEKPARDRLQRIVDDFARYDVVGEAANGEQALKLAAELRPDIVLLDIRMPGIDGIETARYLNALDTPPAVVFTTAYDEYAVDAFDARAIGYVLKPVRRERLERALEHAARITARMLERLETQPGLASRRGHVCARVHDGLRLIPIGGIRYFTADQKYVRVHHDGGEDLIDEPLKSLERDFAPDFVRIHRGALVAVERIERLERTADGKARIVLRGTDAGDELVVSRRHVADVRRRLKGD